MRTQRWVVWLAAGLFAAGCGTAVGEAPDRDAGASDGDTALDTGRGGSTDVDAATDAVDDDVAQPDATTPDTGADARVDAVDDAAPDAGEDARLDADTADTSRDRDGDGVVDELDAFPDDETEWADTDGDGVGDNSDACPEDETDSVDTDGDGVCDASDLCPDGDDAEDRDGDGVCDAMDAFPDDIAEWLDTDGDGTGNNADLDDDDDGIDDLEEMAFGEDCLMSDPLSADTDRDDIPDADDPFPRDPYAEFMVRSNDAGTIDLYLSNRDGTFRDAVQIGEPLEHEGVPLEYTGFAVADFDRDGRMDFLAHTTFLDGTGDSRTRHLYFFYRDDKEDEFVQVFIGPTDVVLNGALTDANGDGWFDVVRFDAQRPAGGGNITGGTITVYTNMYSPAVACAVGETLAEGCFFRRAATIDVGSTVRGEWIARMALQAVTFDEDEHRDLTLISYSSGGNDATDVYTLFGDGAGGYSAPERAFVHNSDRSQAPGNSFVFADFNGDGVGDLLVGFDDDGLAGDAWTYLGRGDGRYEPTPIAAVDLNPSNTTEEGGGERLGRTGSARTFDFDFDGASDLIVGYDHRTYDSDVPGQTRMYRGNGDGTFGPDFLVIGGDSVHRHRFAIPTFICPEYRRE